MHEGGEGDEFHDNDDTSAARSNQSALVPAVARAPARGSDCERAALAWSAWPSAGRRVRDLHAAARRRHEAPRRDRSATKICLARAAVVSLARAPHELWSVPVVAGVTRPIGGRGRRGARGDPRGTTGPNGLK